MEHRWGERLLVDLPVHVSTHAFSQYDGKLTDLSVSGAHLQGDVELRPLMRVELVVVLPQVSKHRAHAIPGYVVRKYRNGYGIEWCEFAPPAVTVLLRIAMRRPYAYIRHPGPLSSVTRSRLSGPLLQHPD
jgi:hypothetical protein